MRISIEIDDQLIAEAIKHSGIHTKKAAVEEGLRLLIKIPSQTAIRKLRGKVKWESDLNQERDSRIITPNV